MEKEKKRIDGRKKGHDYERKLASEFSDILGEKIYTNRYVNKLADDKKVDITLPNLNIQAKCTATNVNYSKVLSEMEKLNVGKNNVLYSKITRRGEYVILSRELFEQIFNFNNNE